MAPFEVMISESQERMCAVVRPERWAAVREVCERWGLPVAVIGRVTDDGDIAIVEGGLDADGRPDRAPRDRPDPGRGPDQRRDRPRADRRAADPPPRRARRPARPATVSDRLPERGMDPGAVLLALLGSAEPGVAPRGSSSSTTPRSAPTPSPGPGAAPRSCGSRARPRRSSRRPTRNQAVGALDPWLRRGAVASPRRPATSSITGARPLGVTNCLNYGDPTRPEAFWQLTEGVRGLGDACRALGLPGHRRQRLALQRVAGRRDRADRREIGVVGLLDDIATLVGPAFAPTATRSLLVGETTPGLAGSAYAAPGRRGAARTARRRSTSRARRRSRRSSARRSRAASSRRPRTCRAAGWRSPSPSARCGAASAPTSGSPVGDSPAVDAVRREPVAARRDAAGPRYAAGARRCWPASTACRSRRSARSAATALVIELVGAGATGAAEERGSRRRRRARGPARRPAPRLGPRPAARPRLGGLTRCAACSASVAARRRADRGRRARGARACSRSSTAARNRPGWRSATASS